MRTPRYSYEELVDLADLYGCVVLIDNRKDPFSYTIAGPRMTRVKVRFSGVDSNFTTCCTPDDAFPHPVHTAMIIPSIKDKYAKPIRINHVEVAFQAALYPQPSFIPLSLPGYADMLIAKKRIYLQQNRKCYYCGVKLRFWNATIDHMIPRDRGGGDMPDNYAIACHACNSDKNNMTVDEYKAYLASKSLLNRRKSLV